MSDTPAAINKGEAIQIDLPPARFGRPANKTAANFIGSLAMDASSATLVHDHAPQLELLGCRKAAVARLLTRGTPVPLAAKAVENLEVGCFLNS